MAVIIDKLLKSEFVFQLSESEKDSAQKIFQHLEQKRSQSHFPEEDDKLQELAELIFFFQDKDFKESAELSRYITRHRLGMRYPNLTGTLTMRDDESSWEFKNGIAPWAYRIVCEELGLGNRQSGAVPEKFIPNKNLD